MPPPSPNLNIFLWLLAKSVKTENSRSQQDNSFQTNPTANTRFDFLPQITGTFVELKAVFGVWDFFLYVRRYHNRSVLHCGGTSTNSVHRPFKLFVPYASMPCQLASLSQEAVNSNQV